MTTSSPRLSRPAGRAGLAALAALAAHAWIAPAMAQPAPGTPPAGSPGTTARPAPEAPPTPGPGPGAGPGPGWRGGPPPGMPGPGMMGPGMMGQGGWAGPQHHYQMHGMQGRGGNPFAGLVFRREDRQLTAQEVQRIAEAMLLWQGERGWKVTQVREAADNTVEFSLTTTEGSVIARFSMDRRSGRLRRIG